MIRPKLKIRKGDVVMVITGRDKGKVGEVLKVFPRESRSIVKGVNIVKRHVKPSPSTAGGIIEKETSIHISNIAYYHEGKPTRLGFKVTGSKKERVSKKTGEIV